MDHEPTVTDRSRHFAWLCGRGSANVTRRRQPTEKPDHFPDYFSGLFTGRSPLRRAAGAGIRRESRGRCPGFVREEPCRLGNRKVWPAGAGRVGTPGFRSRRSLGEGFPSSV